MGEMACRIHVRLPEQLYGGLLERRIDSSRPWSVEHEAAWQLGTVLPLARELSARDQLGMLISITKHITAPNPRQIHIWIPRQDFEWLKSVDRFCNRSRGEIVRRLLNLVQEVQRTHVWQLSQAQAGVAILFRLYSKKVA